MQHVVENDAAGSDPAAGAQPRSRVAGQYTILVLGAQGLLGRFTARRLQAAGHRVLRAGRRPEAADDFRLVDLDDIATLRAALQGVDLVVSSVEDPDTRAEREILRGGGMLLSQATLPAAAQRRLRAEAGQGARGTVLLNAGLTGVMGLAVKDLLARHAEADTVEIGFVGSVLASIGATGGKTAHAWFSSAPRLRRVVRQFSAPRGHWPCFDMSHYDFLWLSDALTGGRRVRMYIGLAERAAGALLAVLGRLGWLRALPQAAFVGLASLRPAPAALSTEPVRVRAAVHRGARLLAACGIEAEGDYNGTSIATALFAQALLERAAKAGHGGEGGEGGGVANVEDRFSLRELAPALARHRIVVRPLAR